MIEPVSSIVSLPPVASVERVATPPTGVEIASGPLPQATSADVLAFNDAFRAQAVENVAASHPLGGTKWSAVGKSVGRFLDDAAQRDARFRADMVADLSGGGADGVVGSHTGSTPDSALADGVLRTDPEFGAGYERLDKLQHTTLLQQLEMVEEAERFDMLSKVTDGLGTAVRHLSNGGG